MQTRDVSKRIAELSPEKRALLLQRLHEQQSAVARIAPTLPTLVPDPTHRYDPFPLSDVQQNYWAGHSGYFDLGLSGTNFYHECEFVWDHVLRIDRVNDALQRVIQPIVRRPGFLDLDVYKTDLLLRRLDQAIHRVIARHDMLRAVMLPDGRQQILPQEPPSRIKVVDLRAKDSQEVEQELERARTHMRTVRGQIDRWPLFEILVHRLPGERLRVHLRIDTLLMDGISREMLIQEWLRQLLNAELPPLECTYRDYVLTWDAFREGELYQRSREYWMSRLPTLPPAPELPLARPIGPQTRSFFVDHRTTLLAPDAWQRLKARAARADLTPSGAVAAAYMEVLAAWSASARFTVSFQGTYRPPIHPQINEILGNFNTVYLLAREHTGGTFEARARRLQQQMGKDLEQRYFSGFQVLRELNRLRGGSGHAAMPIMFNSIIEYSHPSYAQPVGEQNAEARSMLTYRPIMAGLHIPQVMLLPTHSESRDGALECNWQAAEEVFPPGLMPDMLNAYTGLLQRLADDERAWQETSFQLAPQAQLDQRAAVNATQASLPGGLLHTVFLAQAYLHPHHMAVVAADQTLTYADLARRMAQVSRRLRDMNVRPRSVVAIVTQPGWEQIVAVLGVLQAGATYLPLDPALPPDQLRALLEHAGAALALTQTAIDAHLAWPAQVQRLCIDALEWHEELAHPLPVSQDQEDIAYLIYVPAADGTTRGVMVGHGAAINTIADVNRRFGVGPSDRLLALSPLHSDLAVYDLFGMLAAGGTIVFPDVALTDPAGWTELIMRERITIWNSTPARLDQLVAYLAERPELRIRSLRLALLSRDEVPLMLADRLKALIDDVEVVSLGGGAEAAIWSSVHRIESIDPLAIRIPYGKPMSNQQVHVLNEALEPCPVWVTGQLYIGGAGLARGYLDDAAETQARFVTQPRTGERLYRTGELARFLPDGDVELLGQASAFPITVHGYRVDPRQIEAPIERHPDVRAAVVRLHVDAAGVERLVAYVMPLAGANLSIGELRTLLREQLPDYMIPEAFVTLDALPLTPTGCVNRAALPPPDAYRAHTRQAHVAPRTPLELQLARLWEDFFGRGPIGVTDNFFDLGGHSFLAVQLMTRVQELFGRDIPLAAFLYEATIEHMAAILTEGTAVQLAEKLGEHVYAQQQAAQEPATGAAGARTPEQQAVARGLRNFMIIWFGQLISQIGTGLTTFALGVWVFQATHSALQLALIGFFGILPIILFSPIAGALVDRWNRRWAMIISDSGAALGAVALVALLATNTLQIWHIYIIVIVASIFRTFQFPAHAAATTQLVPKEQLARASGMVQLSQGVGQLVSPVLAGLLVGFVGLAGVIAVDFATFLVALITLMIARIPDQASRGERRGAAQGQGSLLREAGYGWRYIRERPGLRGLLTFVAISQFMLGAVIVLSTPLLLAFTTPAVLGTVLSVAGLGVLAGGVLISVWGGPKRRVYGAFAGLLLSGVCIMIAGLAPSAILIGAAAFFFTLGTPIIASSSQAIWQRKVPQDLQGRVFAIRGMVATGSLALAYLVCGSLDDYVFEPLMSQGGALADSIGQIIGVGPGRGIGLLFILLGMLALGVVVAGFTNPRIRHVEEELPDADTPAEPAPPTEPVDEHLNGYQPQLAENLGVGHHSGAS